MFFGDGGHRESQIALAESAETPGKDDNSKIA
jgi:hypothetical protein